MSRTGRWLLRAFNLAVLGVAGIFALRYARQVDWPAVGRVLVAMPPPVLLSALALSALSHLACSSYDLLGRHYTGHGLPVARVMQVNFVSYACNINLGALLGAVAVRLRLYTRLGLAPGAVTQVFTLSVLTNWLGYALLAGTLFLLAPLPLPPGWALGRPGLRALGLGLLAALALYIALCAGRRRHVYLRGHALMLPPPRLVAVQLALSVTNWALMGALLHLLLRGQLPYAAVLATLLLAALAGVLTHVPAGLGVLEAVVLALLSHRVPAPQLLAACLAYRAVYYLGPLALALALYLRLETGLPRRRAASLSG